MSRRTILGQLLVNITIPVVLVLILFSYTNYHYNKAELEKLNRERLAQLQQEAKNLIEIYDYGMKMNEAQFEGRMEKLSHQLVDAFQTTHDPATCNLYDLSAELGLDTNAESIYIIDKNGVVVNTSFYKDLNLNFYARGEGYREYFEKIWAQNHFFADRFSPEKVTGRIKKWSFIPTADGQYLIELGFLSAEAKIMREKLHAKVNEIADQHSDIEQVFLAMQVRGESFDGIQDSSLQHKMQEVLVTQKNQRLITEEKNRTVYEDLLYIPVLLEETSMFSGIVLYIKSDDSKERALVSQTIKRFVLMALLALALLILIITFRARRITRPILRLTKKAELIKSGKLDERIEPEGNNEITQLSATFNHMVEQLQDSYKTLEQKVIDRTAEVVEQKNEAEYQRHLVEEKNKEILDSITYAKRIQNAILPPNRLVKEHLPDSFILYKPKDIVAGDFYWLHVSDTDPDLVHFAAADCTGHGVPGALVSVVCHNALNRSVREYGISEPGKILDKTRELVIHEFEKSDDVVKDGMDISLCALSRSTKQLSWSGANNPLWIIRKNPTEADSSVENSDQPLRAHGHELLEVKPDKQPIGKYAEAKPFTSHTVDLKPGDTLYIFTDGYADQFGGERGKKFKASALKELLLSIQALPMNQQRQSILEAFENWRGKLEQIDDVCIIGVRI